MNSKRMLAVLATVVMALGLLAGPAQASSGDRAKKRTHVTIRSQVDPAAPTFKLVGARLTRGGKVYANKVVVIQYKSGRHWRKLRGIPAHRTDASGVSVWEICVRGARPAIRVHFNGDRKSAASDSRAIRSTRCAA